MKLIPCNESRHLEYELAIAGASVIDTEDAVYGGGAWTPGSNYAALLASVLDDQLRGVVGLTITEAFLQLSAPLRSALGVVLADTAGQSRIYVTDEVSVQLAMHYGLNAINGGHPGWLCPRNCLPELTEYGVVSFRGAGVAYTDRGEISVGDIEDYSIPFDEINPDAPIAYVAVNDVGLAIYAALIHEPCLLFAVHPWGQTNNLELLPIVRWAKELGLQGNLVYSLGHLKERLEEIDKIQIVPPAVVQAQREKVEATFMKLQRKEAKTAQAIVTSVLGGEGEGEDRSRPRELVLGAVFDPATHYTEEYFGEGAGLRYVAPDGSMQTYHGPAHEWGVFPAIFEMITTVLPKKGGLLDIGCGAGAVVRHALKAGYDAYGVDISESAIARGRRDPQLANRLVCADITKTDGDADGFDLVGTYDVITALDFWEHIYLKDIAGLIASVRDRLTPGGIGFFIICTRGKGEPDWTIPPGATFTKENSWLLCSGHVTIRRWGWWMQQFIAGGLQPANDLAHVFQVLRDEDPGLRGVASWGSRNLVIVRRPK